MSSAGTDGCRTCGGTEQDSAPDVKAGRGGGRLPGRKRLQFERSGVKGAEVEADGRRRTAAGSAEVRNEQEMNPRRGGAEGH